MAHAVEGESRYYRIESEREKKIIREFREFHEFVINLVKFVKFADKSNEE